MKKYLSIALCLALFLPALCLAAPVDRNISQLPTENSIDVQADYFPFWDASAGRTRKTNVYNLSLTALSVDFSIDGISAVTDFASFITASASGNTTWVFTNGVTVSATASVPTGVHMYFLEGGYLTITSGVTVTHSNDPTYIQAPLGQWIFRGAGKFVFTSGGEVSAMWFGFGASGNSAANNGDYMDNAMDSISSSGGGVVRVPLAGTFTFDNFTIDEECELQGQGNDVTYLQSEYAGNCVTMSEKAKIRWLTLDGVSKQSGSVGVYNPDNVNKIKLIDCTIQRFEINEKYTSGIYVERQFVYNLNGVTGFVGYTDAIRVLTHMLSDGGRFSGHTGAGVYLEVGEDSVTPGAANAIKNIVFDTVDMSGNSGTALIAKGVYGLALKTCWFENNTVNHIAIYDADIDGDGTDDIYTSNLLIEGGAINPLVTGGGVYINSLNYNFTIRDVFLNGHTWDVVNASARWFVFDNCYESGVTKPTTYKRFITRSTSLTFPIQATLPGEDATIAYEQITFDGGNFKTYFSSKDLTGATATTLFTLPVTDGKAWTVEWTMQGNGVGVTPYASYSSKDFVYRSGGGAVLVAPTSTPDFVAETSAGYSGDLDVNGNNVRLRFVGDATIPMTWKAWVRILEN